MSIIKVDYGDIASGGGTNYHYVVVQNDGQEVTTHTISNQNGKRFLILLSDWASSSNNKSTYLDNSSVTGGTLTKLCNLFPTSARGWGTFFELEVTSDTCVITPPSGSTGMFLHVFEAT